MPSMATVELGASAPTRTGEAAVVTDGLTKRYGSRAAVDGLSLTVRRGEVFGFLGPNGAGKTTTLRMLVGLVRPTSGSAWVLGRPAGESVAGIGALIEGPGLYPFLSGRDNLRVLAKYAGTPRPRIAQVLATVDLVDRAEDRYGTYSLGMKQRLGVAAALLKQPELVVLDEPTNGLDPAGITDMRALLRTLAAEGCTVVLSSHLLAEVEQVCDRVAVVSNGRLIVETTVGDLVGLGRLVIEAEPIADAAAVISGLLGAERVSVVGRKLHVRAGTEFAGRINRALVLSDVNVTGLRQEARTLEEVFLQMTGPEPVGDDRPQASERNRRRFGRRAPGR